MTETRPTITVVMPVRNCAPFVAETLESILAQTYLPLEVIVIDDASSDGTTEIVSSYSVRGVQHILRTDQQNIYSAHNQAIARARGELIAFMSGDDYWLPKKLALQADLLAANPAFGYAITYSRGFLDENYPPPPETIRETQLEVRQGPLLEAVLARKSLFTDYGGFSEAYQISADVEWFARMNARRVAMGVVEQVLVHKRVHSSNTSMVNPALTRAELLHILRDAAHERSNGTVS